uniref:Uncharacterized protein n=1 Tax=Anguilla anguilla TaxID=7936 RepID=A0A0E9S376_ANGAN
MFQSRTVRKKRTAFLSDSARPLLFAQDLCSARSA